MNLKTKLFLVVVLLLNIPLFAQDTFTLSGTVRSAADDTALPGVSVLIVNTTDGVITDFDGNFEIDVKIGDQLQVSYLGYVSQTVDIQSQSPLEIAMVEDMNQLDEVVVIGYGTQKKSSVTGAVAQIDGDNIASVQATRVDQALTGKLAGVLVQNQDGAPGADPKIQIRAASSISSDVSPLIVVDGYPISGSLATVNPNDIESLEVLKDAASAAIFGSRGANGVILVTTKKGRTGKASFTYDGYISSSSNYF